MFLFLMQAFTDGAYYYFFIEHISSFRFVQASGAERKRQHLTQKALAERLHMSVRTIIEIEECKSNPKFETVALLAKELNISLDAAIFPDMVTGTVSKTVIDFFAGKSEAEIQKYIALCKQAETFQKDK